MSDTPQDLLDALSQDTAPLIRLTRAESGKEVGINRADIVAIRASFGKANGGDDEKPQAQTVITLSSEFAGENELSVMELPADIAHLRMGLPTDAMISEWQDEIEKEARANLPEIIATATKTYEEQAKWLERSVRALSEELSVIESRQAAGGLFYKAAAGCIGVTWYRAVRHKHITAGIAQQEAGLAEAKESHYSNIMNEASAVLRGRYTELEDRVKKFKKGMQSTVSGAFTGANGQGRSIAFPSSVSMKDTVEYLTGLGLMQPRQAISG